VSVVHPLCRPTGDETVPHPSSVSCSMGGRVQTLMLPRIFNNLRTSFFFGHDSPRRIVPQTQQEQCGLQPLRDFAQRMSQILVPQASIELRHKKRCLPKGNLRLAGLPTGTQIEEAGAGPTGTLASRHGFATVRRRYSLCSQSIRRRPSTSGRKR
jgi:hypothetical protein